MPSFTGRLTSEAGPQTHRARHAPVNESSSSANACSSCKLYSALVSGWLSTAYACGHSDASIISRSTQCRQIERVHVRRCTSDSCSKIANRHCTCRLRRDTHLVQKNADIVALLSQEVWVARFCQAAVRRLDDLWRGVIVHLRNRNVLQILTGS